MATETFTLTLNDAPTESVSVTINDTSQDVKGSQLGYITGLNTYARRAIDIPPGSDDKLVWWNRGSNILYSYASLLQGDGSEFTAQDTQITDSNGVDAQGWYQLAVSSTYVYVARPLANSNDGRLDVYNYSSGNISSGGTGSPNNGTGYLSSNNFGFYKIVTPGVTNHIYAQDGYTGHRNVGLQSVTNISPNGINIFTQTSGPTTRYTRGLDALSTGSGNSVLFVTGRTPSSNSVTINGYWLNPPGGGSSVGGSITVTGNSSEVARHNRLFYCHDSSGTIDGDWFLATTGANAGIQIHRVRVAGDGNSISFSTIYTDNNFGFQEGSVAIQQVQNPVGDVGACMVWSGLVYGITYNSTLSGSSRINISQDYSLYNTFSGTTSTGAAGLCRMNDSIIAWVPNDNSIYIHENNFYK